MHSPVKMSTFVASALMLMAASPAIATVTEWPVTTSSASSEVSGWPATNLRDGSTGTLWGSSPHATAQNSESITFGFAASHPTNFVKLGIRPGTISALGFPVDFSVSWYDGSLWHEARGFTHYLNPGIASPWVTLPLPATVVTSQLKVTAKVLGSDTLSTYAFQLTEVKAGLDTDLSAVEYPVTSVQANSSLPTWPVTGIDDGNLVTAWSSNLYTTAASFEWVAYWWNGLKQVNYIKASPALLGRAWAFPGLSGELHRALFQWHNMDRCEQLCRFPAAAS